MFNGFGVAFQLRWPLKISLGFGMAIRCSKNDADPLVVAEYSTSDGTTSKKDLLDPYEILDKIRNARRATSQKDFLLKQESLDSSIDCESKEGSLADIKC
jgi:hypothetical protein